MSWVVLCIAQVSVFRKEGSAWVPAGFDVGDEWRPAEFSRNDTNGCKINIRNSESRVSFKKMDFCSNTLFYIFGVFCLVLARVKSCGKLKSKIKVQRFCCGECLMLEKVDFNSI